MVPQGGLCFVGSSRGIGPGRRAVRTPEAHCSKGLTIAHSVNAMIIALDELEATMKTLLDGQAPSRSVVSFEAKTPIQ